MSNDAWGYFYENVVKYGQVVLKVNLPLREFL